MGNTCTHIANVLVSACNGGYDHAALPARFEAAVREGGGEAMQLTALSKVLCDFTVEYPFERATFATATIRDQFFLPSVQHATTPEAVRWVATAMHSVTDGEDAGAAARRTIFATSTIRNGFFLPLVQHTTSPEAVLWIARALNTIVRGDDEAAAARRHILATATATATATPKFREFSFFPPSPRRVTSLRITKDAHKDIFATATVRDQFFLPLVKHATSPEAVEWIAGAMHNIACGDDAGVAARKDIFATAAVRDHFFLPLVAHATSPDAAQELATAIGCITDGDDATAAARKEIFNTDDFRLRFFPQLEKHASSRLAVTDAKNALTGLSVSAKAPVTAAAAPTSQVVTAIGSKTTLPLLLTMKSTLKPESSALAAANPAVVSPLRIPANYVFDGDLGAHLVEHEAALGLSQCRMADMVADCEDVAACRVRNCTVRDGSCPLTVPEALAIALYTHDLPDVAADQQFYFVVNETLRLRERERAQALLPFRYLLCRALDQLPPLCEPGGSVEVYRGISGVDPDRIQAAYAVGTDVQWTPVTSLSLARSTAQRFTQRGDAVLFVVTAVSARCVEAFSQKPDEQEVVLRPDTRFVVTKVEQGAAGCLEVSLTERSGAAVQR